MTICDALRLLSLTLVALAPLRSENAAQVFARAAASLASREYAAAEQGFLRVLEIEPNHVGALGNLGVIYSRTNRGDKAISTYKRALKLAPSDTKLSLDLGLAYLRQEDYADALPVFRRLAAHDPTSLQYGELLATCELYTGRTAAATAALEALRAKDSANSGLLYLLGVAYLKQKARDKARVAFDDFLASMPASRASFLLCKAYYESGLLDEAEEQCHKTLAAEPEFPRAHLELGKIQVSRRSPDAEASLAAAIKQDAQDAEALYFMGGLLLEQDRIDEAEMYLGHARDLNPGFWGNYFYLGKAKMQRKMPAQGIAWFEKAAELNGAESAVFYQLSRAYSAVGRVDDARRAMQRVRELKAIAPK